MQLSPREKEVIELLANGQCPGEIAFSLGIAKSTVACYMERARKKMKAENVMHTVAIAVNTGAVAVKLIA